MASVEVLGASDPKINRFPFSETYDAFLLRAVRSVDGHIPESGMVEPLFQQGLETFVQQIQAVAFNHLHRPSNQTLSDRFNRLVAHRRDTVKSTLATSGII